MSKVHPRSVSSNGGDELEPSPYTITADELDAIENIAFKSDQVKAVLRVVVDFVRDRRGGAMQEHDVRHADTLLSILQEQVDAVAAEERRLHAFFQRCDDITRADVDGLRKDIDRLRKEVE